MSRPHLRLPPEVEGVTFLVLPSGAVVTELAANSEAFRASLLAWAVAHGGVDETGRLHPFRFGRLLARVIR